MIELNIPVWVNDKSSYQKRLMKQKWSKWEYSHLKDKLSNRMIKINEQTDSTEFSLRGTKGACSRWGSEPLHEKVSCLEEIFSQEKRDQERLELYKKFGFKVLYIWETDLKNPDNVEQSIKEFLKEV